MRARWCNTAPCCKTRPCPLKGTSRGKKKEKGENQQLGDKSVLLHLIFRKHVLESSIGPLSSETQNNSVIQAFVCGFAFLSQAVAKLNRENILFPTDGTGGFVKVFLFQLVLVSRNVASLKKAHRKSLRLERTGLLSVFTVALVILIIGANLVVKCISLTNHVLELVQA